MRVGLVLGILVGVSACGPDYDGLEITLVGGDAEQIDRDGMVVMEGRAAVIEVDPRSSRKDYDASDELTLESSDAEIARVDPGVHVDTWMVMGVAPGDAEVRVRINGTVEDRLTVTVEEAP
jgi:hypothetical protein